MTGVIGPQTPKGALASIKDLKPFPGNPRRGDTELIKESLEENGQYRPIVVNRPTMEVLAGNHTVAAARELGWTQIAVTYVEVTAERARRIALVDNRANDLAGYDEQALVGLLEDLGGELTGTGYGQEDLDLLIDGLRDEIDLDDDSPPLPAKPKTRPGDLYILGNHRLLCGDARDSACLKKLLGNERVDLLWTDPPYGVSYEGKTADALEISGDQSADIAELLAGAFSAVDAHLKRGARIYVCHPSGELSVVFVEAFLRQAWRLHQQLIWAKDSFVIGRADYHYRHESILYGSKPGRGRIGRGGTGWYGDDSQSTLLEIDRPTASREHPTMKPPALIEIALRNSTSRSHLVLDPFAGSGSTMAACEATGRRARLIELDPRYCDVIVNRFEQMTGSKPELRRD